MTEITSKASRFEMRLTPSQKERLDRAAEFLIVDRIGTGNNLQEHFFDEPWTVGP